MPWKEECNGRTQNCQKSKWCAYQGRNNGGPDGVGWRLFREEKLCGCYCQKPDLQCSPAITDMSWVICYCSNDQEEDHREHQCHCQWLHKSDQNLNTQLGLRNATRSEYGHYKKSTSSGYYEEGVKGAWLESQIYIERGTKRTQSVWQGRCAPSCFSAPDSDCLIELHWALLDVIEPIYKTYCNVSTNWRVILGRIMGRWLGAAFQPPNRITGLKYATRFYGAQSPTFLYN